MVFYRSSPAPPNHPSVITQSSCWVEALPQAAASGHEIILILSHHPRGHEQVLERGGGEFTWQILPCLLPNQNSWRAPNTACQLLRV